ncbi:hypothetical protein NNJEOMEG_01354 [Fundidesulfovibrio magnetotacticus]|uniref:Uncharacterized protein n=1 Tax=Fundidesulfovibrio magnetotacticus TaxID=2730080 RepID=A0A6V8LRC2_9BACT|nr:hypothetical protein [Fundidesulfovibrio magnetotacticus]GFK93520.1 hypothetical protein NNJEOMEG_01354 [Fundidesulfovibrio magnetotacticus]
MREWSLAKNWSPDTRYRIVGSINRSDATERVAAIKTLMEVL